MASNQQTTGNIIPFPGTDGWLDQKLAGLLAVVAALPARDRHLLEQAAGRDMRDAR